MTSPVSELREILERITRETDSWFSEPATPAQISACEVELGIVFPEEYREFCHLAGGGMIDTDHFFGVLPLLDADGTSDVWTPNVSWQTRQMWKDRGNAARDMIRIAEDFGAEYAMVWRGDRRGEVHVNTAASSTFRKFTPTLGEFLLARAYKQTPKGFVW